MATVNFIGYKTQGMATLKGVMAYVSQKQKTEIAMEHLEFKHQQRTNPYPENPSIHLVSGINCTPESACSEFISTKASYNKMGGVQFYHYTQSFQDGADISPKTAHEIAVKFAEENYKDYEVLVATHMDNEHLHSHLLINSVSFATGKKLHQPPDTLKKLRQSSDDICKSYGLETLEPYTFGRSKTMSRAEKRAYDKGTSWKFDLCLTIEDGMKRAKNKEEFVDYMEKKWYRVSWSESRKNITYTCYDGKKCRDNKLYGKKYLKENMELELECREQEVFPTDLKTGWEYERGKFLQSQMMEYPSLAITKAYGLQILDAVEGYCRAVDKEDELSELANLAALTLLSYVGVYLLVEELSGFVKEELAPECVVDSVDELLEQPENNMWFQERKEKMGFEMSM